MNGFSPADMSTAAANGHAEGYQAGYADSVKAFDAAQPAAAPGIDLAGLRKVLQDAIERFEVLDQYNRMKSLDAVALQGLRAALAQLDASPKGGTFSNDGSSEAQFIADGDQLNCPACGGSGHFDDNPKGGENMRDWSLRMAKLEEGQHVGAGAHGLEDSPKGGSDAPTLYSPSWHEAAPYFECSSQQWSAHTKGMDEYGKQRLANMLAHHCLLARRDELGWIITRFDLIASGRPWWHVSNDGRLTYDYDPKTKARRVEPVQAPSAEVGS